MFDPEQVAQIAKKHKDSLRLVRKVEKTLNARFFDMEESIRALILAVVSGEPLLLIGPPGTAKSKLVRAFCEITGILHDPSDGRGSGEYGYFEYLLTPFTEPGELFGYFDIAKLNQGKDLERKTDNMMQKAKIVYLDEVFNGSSAILNSILTFLQERTFHDRGVIEKVAFEVLFGATNKIPEDPQLRAVFDRFVIRARVSNAASNHEIIGQLLDDGWKETFGSRAPEVPIAKELFTGMKGFRRSMRQLPQRPKSNRDSHWDAFLRELTIAVAHTRQYDMSEMSNRRLIKIVYIMMIHRIYEAANDDNIETILRLRTKELHLIPRYFLDDLDEQAVNQLHFREIDASNS